MSKELEFKISTGLKNIIGRELITNDLIAIFELVKNSYDAGAKKVKIVFENIKEENTGAQPRILIIDDGKGMSYQDIKDKWLFVAYSEKKEFEKTLQNVDFRDKISSRRAFAGAKGIGRFSCDKLGKYLKLYTKKADEDYVHSLNIDWGKFENDSREEFHMMKVYYDSIPTNKVPEYFKNFSNGTVLEISSLNSNWDRTKLLKLKRHLQRLINPSQMGEEQEFQVYLEASEFIEEDDKNRPEGDFSVINGPVKNVVFEKLDLKVTQITCSIDETGMKIRTELIDKGIFIFRIKEKNEYNLLRNINVNVSYLNPVAKATFRKLMGIQVVNYGSVFLYKNGFRIQPYGEEGDDWLGLDKRKGQGYARNLGTREVIGRVEINGYQPNLREVSSRDGGVEKTDEYYQLLEFFQKKALRRLERYVVEGIAWDSESKTKSPEDIKRDSLDLITKLVGEISDPEKKVDFNPNLIEIFKDKQVEKLPELAKNLESLKNTVQDPEEKEYIESQLKAFKQATRTFIKTKNEEVKQKAQEVKDLKKNVRKIEKEILFLTSIAGEDEKEIIGLQHHIGISTSTIQAHLQYLQDKINKQKHISNEELLSVIENINLEVHKIASISNFITKANFNLMTETIEKDLVSFIRQYVENIFIPYKDKAANKINFNIRFDIKDDFEFLYKFKPLEIIIIFDNLLNNSIKAKATNIEISMAPMGENGMWIKVKDDGIGIPKENIKDIFKLGYTTTGGSGIGLYHVERILQNINGTIEANDSLQNNGAEFTIRVRK